MGPTWGPPGSCRPRWAPYWPHEPCYQGNAAHVCLHPACIHNCNKTQTHQLYDTQILTHWGWDKMDAISQMTFSNAISRMKMFEFPLKCHWSLFLKVQLTIFQHRFRYWLGVEEATSRYLNQWWPSSTTHICVTRPQWVKQLENAVYFWQYLCSKTKPACHLNSVIYQNRE